MTKKDNYGADQISVLEGLEPVRKRPGMYIGSTGPDGLHTLVREIFDNSRDEAMGGYADRIEIAVLPNDTIRIVEYHINGSIVDNGVVKIFNFNESTGELIWSVTESSKEKYYCIYFDVEKNAGERTGLNETENMTISGDANVSFRGSVGGWWAEIIDPTEGSYTLIKEALNITVETKAKANKVTTYVFLEANEDINFTQDLNDVGGLIRWANETLPFDKEGNWTIRVTSRDKAGYEPEIVECVLYVGRPNLALVNISIDIEKTHPSSTIYKGDKLNITAHIMSYNVTIDNVTVILSIYVLVRFYNLAFQDSILYFPYYLLRMLS